MPDKAKARIEALEGKIALVAQQMADLSPRRIDETHRAATCVFLNRFPGAEVSVVADFASAEAAHWSKGMVATFRASGWNVRTPVVMGIMNPPDSGIGVRVPNAQRLSPPQLAIVDALKAARIDFELNDAGQSGLPNQTHVAEMLFTTPLRK